MKKNIGDKVQPGNSRPWVDHLMTNALPGGMFPRLPLWNLMMETPSTRCACATARQGCVPKKVRLRQFSKFCLLLSPFSVLLTNSQLRVTSCGCCCCRLTCSCFCCRRHRHHHHRCRGPCFRFWCSLMTCTLTGLRDSLVPIVYGAAGTLLAFSAPGALTPFLRALYAVWGHSLVRKGRKVNGKEKPKGASERSLQLTGGGSDHFGSSGLVASLPTFG